MNHTRSKEWFEKAKRIIPGGVHSPVRSFKHVGCDPIYFDRGEGAYLFDVDNNRYVDFCLSFGPHILGHSSPNVVAALKDQAARATSFGACHPKEVELVELLLKAYPFLQEARLLNSGTEAVMTAVRLARGFTGRNKIVKFEGCYHGHSDGFLAKAGSGVAELSEASSQGIPPSIVSDTLISRLDSLSEIERLLKSHGSEIAAVLMEPIPANYGLHVPARSHLEAIASFAKKAGALLIFDEVISGFRVGLNGAAGYYGIEPDLVTLGKIIGGGLPLAAVLGRREILDCLAPVGSVYQAGTLSGNPLATAAGCAVLQELFQSNPYAELEERTKKFSEALQRLLSREGSARVSSIASIFWISFDETNSQAFPPPVTPQSAKRYATLFQKLLSQGIYLAPSPYEVGFLSTAHTPSILEGVLEKVEQCLK